MATIYSLSRRLEKLEARAQAVQPEESPSIVILPVKVGGEINWEGVSVFGSGPSKMAVRPSPEELERLKKEHGNNIHLTPEQLKINQANAADSDSD